MDKKKFEFLILSGDYIVWLWKGDYLNFGVGLEIGIYDNGGFWWDCDSKDLVLMIL